MGRDVLEQKTRTPRIAYGVESVLRSGCADANFCARCCIIHTTDAAQYQGVTLTDSGLSADRSGIREAVDTCVALETDAREERSLNVGVERRDPAGGVCIPRGVGVERTVPAGGVFDPRGVGVERTAPAGGVA
jgi:hypothetical protein